MQPRDQAWFQQWYVDESAKPFASISKGAAIWGAFHLSGETGRTSIGAPFSLRHPCSADSKCTLQFWPPTFGLRPPRKGSCAAQGPAGKEGAKTAALCNSMLSSARVAPRLKGTRPYDTLSMRRGQIGAGGGQSHLGLPRLNKMSWIALFHRQGAAGHVRPRAQRQALFLASVRPLAGSGICGEKTALPGLDAVALGAGAGCVDYNRARRSRRLLLTTVIELKAIANAASTGWS